jgi:reverse gyrase
VTFAENARGTKGSFGMDIVIVESPAKAKTINKYLGKNYAV